MVARPSNLSPRTEFSQSAFSAWSRTPAVWRSRLGASAGFAGGATPGLDNGTTPTDARPGPCPRAGLGVPPPHATLTDPGPLGNTPALASAARAKALRGVSEPRARKAGRGGAGRAGGGAEPGNPAPGERLASQISLTVRGPPRRGQRGHPDVARPGGNPEPREPKPPPPRRPRGLARARRVLTPPATSPRGPAVRSPARLPRAMQPPPAPRA